MFLVDQDARDRICGSLNENLLVEAAAGTGKTTALVSRLVSLFQAGNAVPDQVVAVTFTRKAAGELRLRLREALDFQRLKVADPVQKRNLERALGTLEEAHIGTIHAFCSELLRERPVEAGVDPEFRELAEDESRFLLDKVFRDWMQEKLKDLSEGMRRALLRSQLRGGFENDEPLERLKLAAASILEWRDYPGCWRRTDYSRTRQIDRLVEQVFRIAALCSSSSDHTNDLLRALRPVTDLATWISRSELEKPRDFDFLEVQLVELLPRLNRERFRKTGPPFSDTLSRGQIIEEREALISSLEQFREQADADLAASLHSELQEFVVRFEIRKQELSVLDFNDLLLLSSQMLRENEEVRSYFQKRFSHIFVDEFQDTDALQAEILLLLSADDSRQHNWREIRPATGKLFLVGDPKQSIYRFRRADVVLYQEIKQKLSERGVSIIYLTQNFRSVSPILQLVNDCFSKEMTGDERSGQAEYVAFDPVREDVSQPSVIVLPVPHPYGRREVTKTAVKESYPQAVPAMIDWLISESNWKVLDPVQEEEVPIAPRHISILFRSFVSMGRDITREYTRGLEARGILHFLVGSRSFHQREEVQTIRTALQAIEWPNDELSVYAALRGSLFSISDRTLFRFRHTCGHLNPFSKTRPENEEFSPVLEALDFLAELHRKRNYRPIVDTLNQLLFFTRAHAGFALRPAGHQVLANLQRVFDLARSMESRNNFSFRGFVDFLEREGDKPSSNEAPVFEEGIDGVRLMTVHGAKGLEFPVVILADPGCPIAFSRPSRSVDHRSGAAAFPLLGCEPWELRENRELELERDRAEGIRIAYVASTRARDILIIPGVGDKPLSGWLNPLNQGIYPSKNRWRQGKAAAGCPEFGNSTVLDRSQYFDGCADFSVNPGLHLIGPSNNPIVWWDPALLDLDKSPNFGLRQEEILANDPGEIQVQKSLEEYQKWHQKRQTRNKEGSVEQFDIKTVTQLAQTESPPIEIEVGFERLSNLSRKSSGDRFGTLVHTVLRDISLQATQTEINDFTRLHGRLLGSSESEIEDAIVAVLRVVEHPLWKDAIRSEQCFRELPIIIKVAESRLVEGTIDLTFRKGPTWVVIDYKTDSDLQVRRPIYERQICWYVYGLSRRFEKENFEARLLAV